MKKNQKEKVVKEVKQEVAQVLSKESELKDIINFIKSKNDNIEVIENDLLSVKKKSKRLFNFKRTSEDRVKVIIRNAIFKSYFEKDTKFTETTLKERDYTKYTTTITISAFETFVNNMFVNDLDNLLDARLENRQVL